MRPKDLPDQPKGLFLFCETCNSQYSATQGDYFLAPPNEPLICERCADDGVESPLVLATERKQVQVIKR